MRFVLGPAALAAAFLPLAAYAEIKPPRAQYQVDVATNSSSIPGMPPEMMGQMMGMGGGPQKSLHLWLRSRDARPAAPEATHDIPPGQGMGPTLPLVLPPVAPQEPSELGDMEKPKARLLFYWGCGDGVRPGQPKVADTENMSMLQFGQAMKGRSAPDRGDWAPDRATWPNERGSRPVPANSSLVGGHFVHGNYTPDIRFELGPQQDFMAPVQLSASGSPAQPVSLEWKAIPTAQGYFLQAMGHRQKSGEMIVWTSSEVQESGFGLMTYLPNDFVKKLVSEKVVLPPSTRSCTIPKGIFDGAEGAMVRLIAYGEELNLAEPPRPADPKATWAPIWTARVRVKSEGMLLLGMAGMGSDGASRRGRAPEAGDTDEAPAPSSDPVDESVDALKKLMPF